MRHNRQILALCLALAILLGCAGCGQSAANPTESLPVTVPESTGQTTETQQTTPPNDTVKPTEPVKPELNAGELYAQAKKKFQEAKSLYLQISYGRNLNVGMVSDASLTGSCEVWLGKLGSEEMNVFAQVTERLQGQSFQFAEYFAGGKAYCETEDAAFYTEMNAQEFAQRYLSWILPDESLYAQITAEALGEGVAITFSKPQNAEKWVGSGVAALAAESDIVQSIELDGNGAPVKVVYSLAYYQGNDLCKTEITVKIGLGTEKTEASELPTNAVLIGNVDIVPKMIRSVLYLYGTPAFTVSATDYLMSQAATTVRIQQSQFDVDWTTSKKLAKTDYRIQLLDGTGKEQTYTQTEYYDGAQYSVAVDGSAPVYKQDITWETMQNYCQEMAMDAIFALIYVAGAEMEDLGDYYYITFSGNQNFSQQICDMIYTLFGFDLDSFATSFQDTKATGYLSISKYTGFPVACGYEMARTHVIGGISYQLTYQIDQSILLYSMEAYENITGEVGQEPQNACDGPLFYKVTDSEGHVMWLLGTIHVGDEMTGNLPDYIYEAFQSADALAVEHDILAFEKKVETDPDLQAQIANGYYYSDGSTIEDHMDAELYAQAKKLMRATGSYNINLEYAKPALWYTLLQQAAVRHNYGFSANRGVDVRLLKLAAEQNKKILDIEDPVEQTLMMVNFSNALQQMLLQDMVETSFLEYSAELQKMYDLWCSGSEEELKALINQMPEDLTEDEKALYQEYVRIMSTDRNAKMLETAKTYLAGGETVFYAVGLAHLLEPDGLLATLAQAGYTVERVTK